MNTFDSSHHTARSSRSTRAARNASSARSPRSSRHASSRANREDSREDYARRRADSRSAALRDANRTARHSDRSDADCAQRRDARSDADRTARRNERTQRRSARSVGADSLAAPSVRALGLVGRDVERPHGRGETARRVEQERSALGREGVYARPAIYTQDPAKARSRFSLPRLSLPSLGLPSLGGLSFPRIPIFALVVAVLVVAALMLFGPARTYYHAWRDAGVLNAEYAVLSGQNEELNHELERLQTLEGIEDEARSRGYVYPNEEALVVTGVEEPELADPALVEEALAEHEQNLPWFVPLLDKLFAYQPE